MVITLKEELGEERFQAPVNNMQELFETDFGQQLKKSVRKTKRYYDGQAIYEVVDKSISGLKRVIRSTWMVCIKTIWKYLVETERLVKLLI